MLGPNSSEGNLRCTNLMFRQSIAEPYILQHIDLEVGPGEIVGLVGHNGSGKSTLAMVLSGLLQPTSGSITIGDRGPDDWSLVDLQLIQQHAGDHVVAQTVGEDIAFGLSNIRGQSLDPNVSIDQTLHAVGLTGRAADSIDDLSGGELHRLALAGCLAVNPRFLILDEMTAGLDEYHCEMMRLIFKQIAANGSGVLVITHRIDDVINADRVVVLKDGHVMASGPPGTVLANIDDCARWDVEIPKARVLAQELKKAGVPIKGLPLSYRELIESL